MFLTRSEYDRGVNTFSPEGRLFQVEYAIEAIKLGSTAIGIQTSEGTWQKTGHKTKDSSKDMTKDKTEDMTKDYKDSLKDITRDMRGIPGQM